MPKWQKVYDLANDKRTVALTQEATLNSEDGGLVSDVALFGSPEWWSAIERGVISLNVVEGKVVGVSSIERGGWPEIKIDSDGEVSTWSALGFFDKCTLNMGIRIEFVVERFRKVMAGISSTKVVVRVYSREA